jgi:hypothetical protein
MSSDGISVVESIYGQSGDHGMIGSGSVDIYGQSGKTDIYGQSGKTDNYGQSQISFSNSNTSSGGTGYPRRGQTRQAVTQVAILKFKLMQISSKFILSHICCT